MITLCTALILTFCSTSFLSGMEASKNTAIKQQLYEQVNNLFNSTYQHNAPYYKNHSDILTSFYTAQIKGIDEDQMIAFALQQPDSLIFICKKPHIIIFFNCLKNYHHAIKQLEVVTPSTQDLTCSIYDTSLAHLAQKLGAHLEISKPSAAFQKYGEFCNNIATLYSLLCKDTDNLVNFIHPNQQELRKKTPVSYNPEWKQEWCRKAFAMWRCFGNNTKEYLYDIITLIIDNQINKSAETDLASFALQYQPPLFERIDEALWDTNYNSKKEIIYLLCKLIEKYNDNNMNTGKTTPTPNQCNAYQLAKTLNLALPDKPINALLDENHVAFKEFEELHEDAKKLYWLTTDYIQKLITALDQKTQ